MGAVAALLAVAGPGLLAGLSDDDPAGVTTYSILGAQFGYQLLWVIPLSTLLLIAFHLLGVRLGIVSGRGFAAVVRDRHGHHAGWSVAGMLVVANSGTICAEFAGVAAAGSLAGIPPWISSPIAAIAILLLVARGSFHRIEHVLLMISALLASYIGAAVLAQPDWHAAGRGLVVPSLPGGTAAAVAVTATLGTTLAPWGLTFIQSYAVDKGLTIRDWRAERAETVIGSILTGVIGVLIAVTCAAVLHPAGVEIETAHDAALALKPLAGQHAALLFGLGLLGAALLGAALVPLATAYSIAEAVGKRNHLDDHVRTDRVFFGAFGVLVVVCASVVSLPGVPLIPVIYLSQLVNAVFLPPQLLLLVKLNRDPRVVGEHRIGRVATATAMLGIAAVIATLGIVVLTAGGGSA